MKAVRIHEFGGPEVLRYEDIPDPKPRQDQVLVRVKACALNHIDLWIRKGLPGVKLPRILGADIAGEIAEVGEYVTGFKARAKGASRADALLQSLRQVCGRTSEPVPGVYGVWQSRRRRELRTDCRTGRECNPNSRRSRF